MKLEIKKFIRFVPYLLFAAGFLIALFLIWPTYQKVRHTRVIIKQEQENFFNKQETLLAFQSLEQKYQSAADQMKKIDQALPAQAELPELLVQLESLSAENNMIFSSVDFTEPETEQVGKTVQIKISVNGTYENFKAYISDLEKNLRLMDTRKIDFQIPDSEEKNIYKFNLDVWTYYQ